MAKNDNLVHYLTDIADAIREKNGTSDPINAQDFANEIKNGGNSGGGSASKWKYYDCLGDEKDESGNITHGIYLADNVKVIDSVTGNLMIAPEAYIDSDEPNTTLAVAYDMSKRVYVGGEWIPLEEFITEAEGIDFSTHPEITEEEFYHIPEVWVCDAGSEEDAKKLFEFVYPIIERYMSFAQPDEDREGFSELHLPLVPWFKSLEKFRPDFGYNRTVNTVWGFWEREKNASWLNIYDTNGSISILPDEEAVNLPFFGIAFQGQLNQWGVGRYTLPDGSTRYGYWEIAG